MDIEKIEGPVPFLLNLGQPEQIIGWAQLYRKEDGTVQMIVDMDERATELVDHFVEIADLKGIGFAGVMRRFDQAQTNPGGHGWTKPVSPPKEEDRPKPHDAGKTHG